MSRSGARVSGAELVQAATGKTIHGPMDGAIEFAIVFTSGKVVFTGGFEDTESIRKSLLENKEVAGSYSYTTEAWHGMLIGKETVETIVDLRSNTEPDEE